MGFLLSSTRCETLSDDHMFARMRAGLGCLQVSPSRLRAAHAGKPMPLSTGRHPPPDESGWHHSRVISNQEIAGAQKIGKLVGRFDAPSIPFVGQSPSTLNDRVVRPVAVQSIHQANQS